MTVFALTGRRAPREAGFGLRASMIPTRMLVVAAALIGLAALSLGVRAAPGATDLSIARAIQEVDLPGWDVALSVGEWLTGAPGGVIVWALLVGGFWLWGRPVESIVLGLGAAIWVPKSIIEEIVARPRPTEDLIAITEIGQGYAFPSGHITAGVAVFGLLAVIAIVRLDSWRGRAWVLAPVALILTLASLSRVESGAHWPTDVLAALLLGAAWLAVVSWVYREMRGGHVPGLRFLRGGLRRIRGRDDTAAASASDGLRRAGSIASTVYLDDRAGVARKVYHASRPVQALYWAAFQAPFPYATRESALRTAAAVRELTGLLSRYWTGDDLVSRVTAIRQRGETWELESELVQGEAPPSNASVEEELRFLQRRFARAGLPTWQIDIENPHAHTNLIRRPDGRLRIIDLESTLVPLIQPIGRWPQMLRDGRVPTFDDVDYARLREYIADEREGLATALGPDLVALDRAVDVAEASAREWKQAEPAIWGRMAGRVWRFLGWERRVAPLRHRLTQAETLAADFVAKPLERWVREGRINRDEADAIRARLAEDSTRSGMRHLGMALAVSVPLRFPFGSLTRFAMVVSFRLRANSQHAAGEIDADTYRIARQTHTWPVALVALIPGLGAGAYLLSPSLRRSGNLLPLLVDQTLYHAPFGLYRRVRLGKLVPTRLPAPGLPSLRLSPLGLPSLGVRAVRLRLPEQTPVRIGVGGSPFPPATQQFSRGRSPALIEAVLVDATLIETGTTTVDAA